MKMKLEITIDVPPQYRCDFDIVIDDITVCDDYSWGEMGSKFVTEKWIDISFDVESFTLLYPEDYYDHERQEIEAWMEANLDGSECYGAICEKLIKMGVV